MFRSIRQHCLTTTKLTWQCIGKNEQMQKDSGISIVPADKLDTLIFIKKYQENMTNVHVKLVYGRMRRWVKILKVDLFNHLYFAFVVTQVHVSVLCERRCFLSFSIVFTHCALLICYILFAYLVVFRMVILSAWNGA